MITFELLENIVNGSNLIFYDKIKGIIILSMFFSSSSFIISGCIFGLWKDLNLLNLKVYGLINFSKWIIGSFLVSFILIITNIVSYSILNLFLLSLTWNFIFQKIYENAKNKDLSKTKTIDIK